LHRLFIWESSNQAMNGRNDFKGGFLMVRKMAVAMTLSSLLAVAPSLSAGPRVFIRPSFGFGYRYPLYPAYWHPRPRVVVAAPLTGELKLSTDDKDARVFVDNGCLGLAGKLKKFDLQPGNHDIELRDGQDNVLARERVAIVPGRTTEFSALGL